MKNLFLIFIFVLTGCSSEPSEDEISLLIIQIMSKPPIYEVKNVNKINGWHENDYYVIEAEYDIVFIKNLSELKKELRKESKFFGGFGGAALKMKFGDFKEGDTIGYTRKFWFIETEKGWRLAN